MCWSAQADLVAGVGVTGIGLVGVGLTRAWRDVPLAALPVLLGAHQLVESQLWAASPGTGSVLRGPAVTAWAAMALVVLPLGVPLAVLCAERAPRGLQFLAAAVGLPVAVVLAGAVRGGAWAVDEGHVMDYGAPVPLLPVVLAGYLLATCLPFLAASERTVREAGVAFLVGALAAAAVDAVAFASIWCAFAAVFSVLIVRRTVHASSRPAPTPEAAAPLRGSTRRGHPA